MVRVLRYGRLFGDFAPGLVFHHPWEVTVDPALATLCAASFQDATPTYASRVAAREVGLEDRPIHPLVLLNLGLSFSVHDVSERAIANLAYIDARFPEPCYPGDTLRASSRVLQVTPTSKGDKGVVHVRTSVENQDRKLVCSFERKALVRSGKVEGRPGPKATGAETPPEFTEPARTPVAIAERLAALNPPRPGFDVFWEDLEVGDVFAHEVGRTVSEAESMQLATLCRNSHPLHTDEHYCRTNSFAKTRVVYGGLVLAWVLALSSRDTAGRAIWDLGLDDGAHPSGVLPGDTLYAATRVVAKEALGATAGAVELRVVGVKNVPAQTLLERGADLFSAELGKTEGRVPEKVVEITRRLLVRRRG